MKQPNNALLRTSHKVRRPENADVQHMKISMNIFAIFVLCAYLCTGCYSSSQLASVTSPDDNAVATVTTREQRGAWLPGPEPPKTKGKWVRLTVSSHGKRVYDSGFEDVGVYQSIPFAFDLAWSPDSRHIAFRTITAFRVVGQDGKSQSFDIVKDNSLISDFKWTSNDELLIICKMIDEPLDMFGYPQHYHGYLAKAMNVRIIRLNLQSGIAERFIQDVKDPTFMFHSIGFMNQEISPYSDRVAFSDGSAICIYDDDNGKMVATAPITGSIEGTWWETDNRVIVGTGLLSGEMKFAEIDLISNSVSDRTSQLLPVWNRMWDKIEWYRTATK